MISTENKFTTKRTAVASATLHLKPHLREMLEKRQTPKGDALETAKVAGILAAKKTHEIIPYCHPIPIDRIAIDLQLQESSVLITATVTAIWKTGVEMEALVAAQVAATTLFDMLKMFDAEMVITDVKVVEKKGGKTTYAEKIPMNFKVAVIVTSDGTFAGKREDRSGKIIQKTLQDFGIADSAYVILPDEVQEIEKTLQRFFEEGFDLVLTTGGTGLGPRDVTVSATRAVIEEEIPGIMEAARSFGQQRTPYAMLSKGIAGRKGKMLVVNLPGSSNGVKESLAAIFPAILHGYPMMQGGGHG